MANSYNNVAVIYQEQGKHEEALEMHTTSLDIMTRILGGDNPPRCSGEQVPLQCRAGLGWGGGVGGMGGHVIIYRAQKAIQGDD